MTRPSRLVGEHGPELTHLPRGYNAREHAPHPDLVPLFLAPPERPDVEDDPEWTG